MAQFLIGIILGIFIGAIAAAYEPSLPEQLRAGLANVTSLVARGTEHAAEKVNQAAGKIADQAKQAGQGSPPAEPAPAASPAPQ